MYIPPWTIVAGLGTLGRLEICQLLPHFEDTSLQNIAIDKARDLSNRFDKGEEEPGEAAFKRRLVTSSQRLMASAETDEALRARLWDHLLASFDIEASLPLSSRVANNKAAELAYHAARTLPDQLDQGDNEVSRSYGGEAWKRLSALFSKRNADFSAIVIAQAELLARLVSDAAERDMLSESDKAQLAEKIRSQIEQLPPELRNQAMERALNSGDKALVGLLASGSSLVGVGIAVNLAGFSAYILAAQAAAIIPFVGGATMVSMLFVLANPLFIGPVLMTAAYLAGRRVKGSHARQLSASIAVQLALKGIADGRAGLRTSLDSFKSVTSADLNSLPERRGRALIDKLSEIRRRVGSPLPPSPWPPEGILATPAQKDTGSPLYRILFSKNGGGAGEALIVGGLTAGDVLYDAVAIDPTVLRAADFSRSEEISDIFDFGLFADRINSMAAESVAGAGNNLRGYVAEQIVAARLVEQGHVVTLPDTANNPGFDLLVDGHAFQVKCLNGLSGLREHFAKYPDMPVFVNSELAEAVTAAGERWADLVFYVEGFNREITDFIMQAALDAGISLGDIDVPYFAVAVSTARNLFGWWQGKVPLSDLPFSVLLDGAVKGGLAAAGGFSGNILGLLLFGPAGALVFGSVGGAGALLGSHWTREQIGRVVSRDWFDTLDGATSALHRKLMEEIEKKIALLAEKRQQIENYEHEYTQWLMAQASDDIVALAEHIYELEFEILDRRQPDRARMCLQTMKAASVLPLAVQKELSDVIESLSNQPSLTKSASSIATNAWHNLKSRVPQKS